MAHLDQRPPILKCYAIFLQHALIDANLNGAKLTPHHHHHHHCRRRRQAYFLSQSLDVKMRREHECEMIRLYHETLMNHRVNADEYSLVECVHLFQVRP